ncbi:MAG: lipopolysaccharide biosynthesis protein [Pyrinomonadaceae bacterium]
MSLGKRVTSGVSWLAVAQVAQRASSLVITAILARHLSPEDFGLIALAVLVINFITYFQEMGLTSALVQRAELNDDHLDSAFWINIGAGLILALVGGALSRPVSLIFNEPRIAPVIVVMMIALPVNGLGWTSYSLLQRRLEFRTVALIEWVSSLASGLIGVGLALGGAGVWALVAQNLSMSVFMAGGRFMGAKWYPRLRFNMQRARELFSFSLSAFGYGAVHHGIRNIDKVLIVRVLGAEALGYYTLAYNLVLLPSLTICGIVERVMFPALASVQSDLARFRRVYVRLARTVALATFPLIIGLGATAPLFVKTVYGEKWGPVVPVLQILIIMGLFEGINITSRIFWSLGRPQLIFWLATLSLIVLTLGFAIGVQWGLAGVAWTYAIVSPVVFILPHLLANRLMKLGLKTFMRVLVLPLFAATVMGIVITLLTARGFSPLSWDWANLSILILIGAIVYAAVIAALGIFNVKGDGLISWLSGQHLIEPEDESRTTIAGPELKEANVIQ